MGAIGGWWGRRTRWQQFLVFLILAGTVYLAYSQVRGPGAPDTSVFTISSSGDGEEQLVSEGRDPA